MTELTLAVTEFDRTTAVTPSSQNSGWYDVELSDLWLSLVGIHGGYQAAISVQAATAAVPGRPVRTLSTSFIRSARRGQANLRVQ